MSSDEPIRFTGGSGAPLAGVLRRPEGTPRGGVVLSHCFTCSKDLHTITRLARHLAREGWTVLRFDFAGIGESGGDFAEETVTRNTQDVVAAAEVLHAEVGGPLCLFGHSLGGAAVLLAAPRIDEVTAVAVLAAPSSPATLADLLRPVEDPVEEEGVVTATIGGKEFRVSSGFLADLERHEQQRRVAELGLPLLVVHAPDDDVVPVSEGEAIFTAARQPKAFVPLTGADHLVSDPGMAARLATVVADWFAAATR
jgi:alpha-beta hydrolase superfamily lysophospholipase